MTYYSLGNLAAIGPLKQLIVLSEDFPHDDDSSWHRCSGACLILGAGLLAFNTQQQRLALLKILTCAP